MNSCCTACVLIIHFLSEKLTIKIIIIIFKINNNNFFDLFFLPTRDSAWAGPKIVLVPPYLYM